MADPGGYTVVFAAQVQPQVAALPKQARLELADALEQIASAPWDQPRYHPRLPPEMRTATYGPWGFMTYVISNRRRLVIVAHLTWAG